MRSPVTPRSGLVRGGIPVEPWAQAEEASRECDAFFVIGTSALVYPAAALPEEPLHRKKLVIEINPEETPLSSLVTLSVRSGAGEALESLREKLLGEASS